MSSGLAVIVVIVVLVFLQATVKFVPKNRVAIVERFGRYHRTAQSGLTLIIPIMDRMLPMTELREKLVLVQPQSVITNDNVEVQISTYARYRIVDAKVAKYEVDDVEVALEEMTQTNLRNVIGNASLNELLDSYEEISARLCAVLDKAAERWGIRITNVLLYDFILPPDIRQAMEKQYTGRRPPLKERSIEMEPEEENSLPRNREELTAPESYVLLHGPKVRANQVFKLALLELVIRRWLNLDNFKARSLLGSTKLTQGREWRRSGSRRSGSRPLDAVLKSFDSAASPMMRRQGVSVDKLPGEVRRRYGSFEKYVETEVLPALAGRGLYECRERRVLRIFPVSRWEPTRAGEAARSALEQNMALGEVQFGDWVNRAPINRALVVLGMAFLGMADRVMPVSLGVPDFDLGAFEGLVDAFSALDDGMHRAVRRNRRAGLDGAWIGVGLSLDGGSDYGSGGGSGGGDCGGSG